MPEEIRVWQINESDALTEVKRSKLNLEARIEKWLSNDISLLSADLFVIGKQVATEWGGYIDLLCLDASGKLVVVELKRDKTPREVTAQALDYASWVNNLDAEQIGVIAAPRLNGNSLGAAFQSRFGTELPESLSEPPALRIVASEIDDSTERIIHYLAETYGIDINAVRFQFFQAPDGREFLVRSFTVAPEVIEQKVTSRSSKRTPHVTREQFFEALDQNGKTVFERVLEHARSASPEMAVKWGTVGFSMNINLDGKRVAVFEGYPPKSVYKQSIYTTRYSILALTQVPEQEIANLWSKVQATRLFQQTAGIELKCPIDHAFNDEQIQELITWLDEVAAAVVKYGLKQ
jgi:hypothetical protein